MGGNTTDDFTENLLDLQACFYVCLSPLLMIASGCVMYTYYKIADCRK